MRQDLLRQVFVQDVARAMVRRARTRVRPLFHPTQRCAHAASPLRRSLTCPPLSSPPFNFHFGNQATSNGR
jgi:hypothetical protein